MPSSPNTLATAPSSISVFFVRRESSSFANRQSGRILEKICLCFTCPAITARATSSAWNVSISLDSSPSESQYTRTPGSAAARVFISGSVSSLIAATTTSSPCARAASSSRKGKRPFPAINPSLITELLQHSTLRLRDKLHQIGDILRSDALAPELFQSLRGVHLRSQQILIRMLNCPQPCAIEASPLQAYFIQPVSMRLPPGRGQRIRQHVLRNGGSTACLGIFANPTELMHLVERAHRGVVLNGHMPGQSRCVGQNAMVADHAVVPDMRVRHNEAMAAYAGVSA